MSNILFYGNCQTSAIKEVLNLPNNFLIKHICCFLNELNENDFLNYIQNSDIIITQPINDNYRDRPYLSTSYIIKNAKKETKIIILDSCYFEFYYVDLCYKHINNKMINYPSDYHYSNMLNCFKNNINQTTYIENYVNNYNFKSKEELENVATTSLNELNIRYIKNIEKYYGNNLIVLSIHDFVKLNYKKKLLFYSMNHPTKFIFQYLSQEIINYLNIPNTINYDIDPLAHTKCILYACIQSVVEFDISECSFSLCDRHGVLPITNFYYNTYTENKLIDIL